MERLYLDTSVYGGYYEQEFRYWSKALIEKIHKGEFRVIFSEVVDGEINDAPEDVKKLVRDIPKQMIEFVPLSDSSIELTEAYIGEGVVGKTSRADCFHIALATLNSADVLVSWNFKHIVNFKKIRGYNAVNYKFGYKILDIRTPREVIGDDEEQ
ncbi:MAG: PIN domain protein [Bacteroidetes bacterium SW_11_45_7]|nr:MAG: PIN domain protein [Bacteroidetes bacterium SW_11_45_7]